MKRIGIVGSGFAADFHLKNLKVLPVEIIGVTSLHKKNREAFANKFDIAAYDDLDSLLSDVDILDICTPPYTHEEFTVKAAEMGKHIILEKPFTVYCGPEDPNFKGNEFPKEIMLEEAINSAQRMIDSVKKNNVKLCYAENWVYAPAVQKAAEVIKATEGQILWMLGEESHSGSHSSAYGLWRLSGGGSIVGKGCHPLTAILYLKRVEGVHRDGKPIRPKSVRATTHDITKTPSYIDKKFLRTDYEDVECWSHIHLIFEDGLIADVYATEIVMGGIRERLEIVGNNFRFDCNISPNNASSMFIPERSILTSAPGVHKVNIAEKINTSEGWTLPSPDENWTRGFPQEFSDFINSIVNDKEPMCGIELGVDTVAVMYSAYLSNELKGAEVDIPQINV
jgi:predicted dehydrogenase